VRVDASNDERNVGGGLGDSLDSLDMAARVHPIEGNNEDESLSLSSESEVPPPAAKRTRGQLDATNANRRKVISGNVLRIPIILLFAASSPDVKESHDPPVSFATACGRSFVVHIPEGSIKGTVDKLQFVQSHQRLKHFP